MDNFPNDYYRKVVLESAYTEAKKHLLEPMMQIHIAHTKMLEKQGIIDTVIANKIKKTLLHIEKTDYSKHDYTGKFEDLFFEIEHDMIEFGGEEVGNIHIARSRNDMGITIYRMVLRKKLLVLFEGLLTLKEALLKKAEEHIETVMIGYTHTQQAQPTTFAHYLKAYIDKLDRDIERIQETYNRINKSPMGAAALTTTGFLINRHQVAEDLAFDGIIENSWDAVAGADYLAESANVVQLVALNLGRFSQDLLLWATQEFDAIRLGNGFVQISSIMPQKRNPVGVEHTRSIASSIVGDTQTVIQMIHNTPFGDIVDTEDDLQPYLWRALNKMSELAGLVSEYINTLDVHEEVLLERAQKSYANVTELADELVRKEGISFRQSHEIVSDYIRKENKEDIRKLDYQSLRIAFKEKNEKDLQLSEEEFSQALCPKQFVAKRQIEGAPSKEIMKEAIEKSRQDLQLQNQNKDEKKENILKKEQGMWNYLT